MNSISATTRSFLASFVYLLLLVVLVYLFEFLHLSPSLAIPFFLAIILSVWGGFLSSIANAIMLSALSVYLFSNDPARIYQNIVLNSILVVGSGWLATSRRSEVRRADVNAAKARLVDSADGNIKKLWMLSSLLKFVDENWGTKTGYDSLQNAKGMADDLALMVKGWRVLAMEKNVVIHDSELSDNPPDEKPAANEARR